MATAVLLTLLLAGTFVVITRNRDQRPGLPEPLQMSRVPSAARPRAASAERNDDAVPSNQRVANVRFAANQTVRVAVLPAAAVSAEVRCDAAYKIVEPATGRVLGRGNRLGPTRVQRIGNGFEIGRERFVAKSVEFVPDVSPGVWVNGHLYRGTLRLVAREQRLMAINRVGLDDYVASVINSEMPADFPDAARRAQAIVARTYAVYHELQAGPTAEQALFASVRSQKYLGAKYPGASGRLLAGETERSRELTAETTGLVCLHKGELFCTYYCAVCGGRTVNGDELFSDASPVLKSVPCNGCVAAERYRWRVEIPRPVALAAVEKLLAEKAAARSVGKSEEKSIGKRGEKPGEKRPVSSTENMPGEVTGLIPQPGRTGALPRFRVRSGGEASAGNDNALKSGRLNRPGAIGALPNKDTDVAAADFSGAEVTGAELRAAWREFNLLSPQFSISVVDGRYHVEGRGHGHGAGLCQWGARGLAASGWSTDRILRHYYPGCEVGRLPSGNSTGFARGAYGPH